jgi:hypothetical protein
VNPPVVPVRRARGLESGAPAADRAWENGDGDPACRTVDRTTGQGSGGRSVSRSGSSAHAPRSRRRAGRRAAQSSWRQHLRQHHLGTPSAPAGLTATPATGQASLAWAAPAGNGSAISGYTATAAPGGATCSTTVPTVTCTVTGLTDGTAYTVSVVAHSNIGDGPAATVTAVPYPSGIMTVARLNLWLDGADTSTMFAASSCTGATVATAGASLGCWKDKSTVGADAVQATGATQPVLATVASRAVSGFDGSSTVMTLNPTLLPNGSSTSMAFVVGRMTDPSPSGSSFRTALSWGAASSGATRTYQKAVWSAGASVNGYSLPSSSGGSWATNAVGILDDDWGASTYTAWFDGAAGSPVSASLNTGTTTAVLGRQVNGSEFWLGQVPEVIVLSGAATTAERRTMQEYLARKWSVILTPRAPTGVTATAGTLRRRCRGPPRAGTAAPP